MRLSGEDSLSIVEKIFFPSNGGNVTSCPSHSIHHGFIRIPGKKETIDEVLVAVMKAPRTYTREDVVEISCHGGGMPLKKVLELCLAEGARMAEPGEFTKRAFLNGRIDLSQAEAVLDIIRSKTDASRKVAAEQLKGDLSKEIGRLRDSIIDVLSNIELAIDFTEEDVASAKVSDIDRRVDELHLSVKRILETADKGIVFREGIMAVICGRPNVGKSSLMNALLRHDRVIVTSVPGTTRDVIEESINICGVTVRLVDTAGIIETQDRVEMEGIKRSREKLEQADIVLFMVDLSRPISDQDEEIHNTVKSKNVIIVANKSDLPRAFDIEDARKRFGTRDILEISALKGTGLEGIEDTISNRVLGGKTGTPEGPVITNLRHKQALEKALEAVERGRKLRGKDHSGELLASDLNEAVYHLGCITGESIEDDVLDRIFSQFCIGK